MAGALVPEHDDYAAPLLEGVFSVDAFRQY